MPRLGIAVFGAGIYDHHPELNNARFANSAEVLIKAFRDRTVVPGDAPKVLNLYNKPLLPNETSIKLSEFVQRDLDDIIIYYCGHGDVATQQGNYRVFLRPSRRNLRNSTLLDIVGLIRDIQRITYGKRVFFLVDACYSGSAISDMQKESMDAGGAELLFRQALADAVSSSGLAIFTASSSLELAYAKIDDETTLFVGALTQCLRNGIAKRSNSDRLSWSDVRDEVARMNRERLGDDAPSPRLTCLTEQVDITREPFFVNQAYEPQISPPPSSGLLPEDLLWSKISDSTGAPALEDFLSRYPRSVYASLATQFLHDQISGLSEIALRQHLREYPASRAQSLIKQRLADLHWFRANESGDRADLRRFSDCYPDDERARQALDLIGRAEQEVLLAEARWLEISKTSDLADLEAFVSDFPDSPRLADATARLSALRLSALRQRRRSALQGAAAALVIAIAVAFVGWRVFAPAPPPATDYRALLDDAGDDPDRINAFLKSCGVDANCKLGPDATKRLEVLNERRQAAEAKRESELAAKAVAAQADKKFLESAGTDLARLQYFVDRCSASSCALEQEGRRRLMFERDRQAKLAYDRAAFQAAVSDIARLRQFLDGCKAPACSLEPDARTRLDQIENAELRSSGGYDETRLNSCLSQCRSASAKEEAARRLGAIRAEEIIYNRARGDPAALSNYAKDCTACKSKAAAEAEVAEISRQRAAMRFVVYQSYDMYGGDLMGPSGIAMIREVDASACMNACQSTKGCIAFSYDKWIRVCYLKDTMVPLVLDPRADTLVRQDQARPLASVDPKRTCAPLRVVIQGDALKVLSATGPPGCEEACVATASCAAFTHRLADNQCTLFRATSGRQTGVQGVVSGIRTQTKC